MRLFLVALALAASAAQGQDYPNKPIRMLVPFAPGGAVDTAARVLAQAMEQRVKWNFVVDNRPGGNGFIATTAAAKSAPDGYTLLMAHTGEFAVNPAPFNTFQELVAQAKAKPGSISFGSAGNGSINHLAGEWLAQAAGIQLLHVPYKGGAPAAAAVAAGDVHFGVMAAPGAIPHMVGLFAPKGTPQAIVDRINKEVRGTLGSPEVQKKFVESAGGEALGMSSAEFLARIKADAQRYKRVVQKAGVKPG